MSEWQPIESAPKDNPILLYVVQRPDMYCEAVGEPDGWQHMDVGYWDPIERDWVTWHSGDPTHWMPLPEPPTLKTALGKE